MNEKDIERFKKANRDKRVLKRYLKSAYAHKSSGKAHYESILAYDMMVNNTINIIPAKNMIKNIGNVGEEGTHSLTSLKLAPRGIRRVLDLKTYDIEFPLKHPNYVMEEVEYRKKYLRVMGWGHPFVSFYRRCESFVLALIYGDKASLKRKLKKLFCIKEKVEK